VFQIDGFKTFSDGSYQEGSGVNATVSLGLTIACWPKYKKIIIINKNK
jgi:hypothetical protein